MGKQGICDINHIINCFMLVRSNEISVNICIEFFFCIPLELFYSPLLSFEEILYKKR